MDERSPPRWLAVTTITGVVVTSAAALAGLVWGEWAVAYGLNLLALPTLLVVWLLVLKVGVQQRRPGLFIVGLAVLPIVGLVGLAAAISDLPGTLRPAEVPFVLGMYLLAPLVIIATVAVIAAGGRDDRGAPPG